MAAMPAFDVAIAGASIGGCTAARFFALAGARVALVERRPDPGAHKVVCTHAIQSSAVPTVERLGLAPLLEERGAVRTSVEAWSAHGGWQLPVPDAPRGYGVTRRTLDPLLRELTAGTPGVELITGRTVVGLAGNGRPAGLEIEDSHHRVERIPARLVVAADGRGSTVARLAGAPGRVRDHNRFVYYAYWRGIRPRSTAHRVWFMEPHGAAVFPNEDDLTVVAVMPWKARLPEFRADPEGAYAEMVAGLPDGPDLEGAERESKLIGKLDMPNVMRPAARPGIAFVGDAALATDPAFGVGCGWAFQSAEWLVDHTAPALLDGGDLDAALDSYRRAFRRRLGPEHFFICDSSRRETLRSIQRLFFRAAATDPTVARSVEEVGTRRRSSLSLFDPRLLARVMRYAYAGTSSARNAATREASSLRPRRPSTSSASLR